MRAESILLSFGAEVLRDKAFKSDRTLFSRAQVDKKRVRESLPAFSPAPNLKEVDLSIARMLLINYITRFFKLLGGLEKNVYQWSTIYPHARSCYGLGDANTNDCIDIP
jgi:hypothetical protein